MMLQRTGMTGLIRDGRPVRIALGCLLAFSSIASAQGPDPAGAPEAPRPPRAAAPIDLSGYWAANITEDWRWRMVTPARGDYASIPLTPQGKAAADAWNPSSDEAAGEQCRSYGAPGLMRAPTRLRFTWLDDNTLKMESDYGMQTRLFHFRPQAPAAVKPTWQGESTAQWVMAAGGRGQGQGGAQAGTAGAGAVAPRFGSMKTVTTRLRPGYLRKNGVPYSTNTILTEHWDVHKPENGDEWMVVTIVVDDSANLQLPWITSMHFKKEPDGGKWNPEPCSARW